MFVNKKYRYIFFDVKVAFSFLTLQCLRLFVQRNCHKDQISTSGKFTRLFVEASLKVYMICRYLFYFIDV